ncbi:MAG: hypothetical protein MdMp024_1888 [Bacteroidales bacterium]|jgi:hypothetical protein
MENKDNQTKEMLEKQFQDLYDKAKQLYPTIDETISSYNNTTAATERLQDYLNLTTQTPYGVSNNQTVLI